MKKKWRKFLNEEQNVEKFHGFCKEKPFQHAANGVKFKL